MRSAATLQPASPRSCSRQRSLGDATWPERHDAATRRRLRTRAASNAFAPRPRDGVTIVCEVQHDEDEQRNRVEDHRGLTRAPSADCPSQAACHTVTPRLPLPLRLERPRDLPPRSCSSHRVRRSLCKLSLGGGDQSPWQSREPRVACFVRSPRVALHRFGRSNRMDIVYIGLTVGFFVVSWAFIVACERLS